MSRTSAMLRRTAVLLAALLLAGCGRRDFRGANVVLIAIDTLRADHLGCYGYPRPTSPRIDRLSAESTVFDTAISQAPWTLPAFASMFTGRLPSVHRAGEGRFPTVSRLDETYPTLAEMLRDAGYATASFVSNVWVGAEVGMARGFEEHDEAWGADHAADGAIEWLGKDHEKPFFLFVHLMDPHQPYAPYPEDAKLFLDPSYAGPLGTAFVGNPHEEWTAADRQRVIDLYDAELHGSDRLVGRVLDTLAARGLDRRTIVVFTSDHGEELFDHGWLSHGHTLYDELLHVPLMVRFPGGAPRRVERQVRTMDLMPTLLEALAVPPPEGIAGVSLMPLVRGEEGSPETDTALAEYVCFGDDQTLKAIRLPQEKLVFSPGVGRFQLFDLRADPKELHDLTGQRPERAVALRAEIDRRLASTLDGFHLIVRGGRETAVVEARFQAKGFEHVILYQPEAEDRFTLSPDGHTLDAVLTLRPQTLPTPGWDLDGITFRTADGGPVVLRSLTESGQPLPPDRVVVGHSGKSPGARLPWRLAADLPSLRVPYPMPPPASLAGDTRVSLAFVQRGAAPTITARPETIERLKAIGYLR
jgi:arylsulfatase A-like enzyme